MRFRERPEKGGSVVGEFRCGRGHDGLSVGAEFSSSQSRDWASKKISKSCVLVMFVMKTVFGRNIASCILQVFNSSLISEEVTMRPP